MLDLVGITIGVFIFLMAMIYNHPGFVDIVGVLVGVGVSMISLGVIMWSIVVHPEVMDIVGTLLCDGIECYLYSAVV